MREDDPLVLNNRNKQDDTSEEKKTRLSRFWHWFRRSGIKYSLAFGKPYQGQEMVDDFPHELLTRNGQQSILAKIYKNTVWQGIETTFHLLTGNHFDLYLSGKGRKGLLDLLVLPLISRRLMAYGADPNGTSPTLQFAARFFGYILEGIRGGLAIALTMAVSPLVVLTHLVTSIKSDSLKKTVLEAEVTQVNEVSGHAYKAPEMEFKGNSNKQKTTVARLFESLRLDNGDFDKIEQVCQHNLDTSVDLSPREKKQRNEPDNARAIIFKLTVENRGIGYSHFSEKTFELKSNAGANARTIKAFQALGLTNRCCRR